MSNQGPATLPRPPRPPREAPTPAPTITVAPPLPARPSQPPTTVANKAPDLPPRPKTPQAGEPKEKIGTPETRRVRKSIEEFAHFVAEMSDVFNHIVNIGIEVSPARNHHSPLTAEEHLSLFESSSVWNAGGSMLNVILDKVTGLIESQSLGNAVEIFLNMTTNNMRTYMEAIEGSVGFQAAFDRLSESKKRKLDEMAKLVGPGITGTTGVGLKPFQHFLRIPLMYKDLTKYLLDCKGQNPRLYELGEKFEIESNKIKAFAKQVNDKFEATPKKEKKSKAISSFAMPHLEKSSKMFTPARDAFSKHKVGTPETQSVARSIKQFIQQVRKISDIFNVVCQIGDDVRQEMPEKEMSELLTVSSSDVPHKSHKRKVSGSTMISMFTDLRIDPKGKVSKKQLTEQEYEKLFGQCDTWKQASCEVENQLKRIEDKLKEQHLGKALSEIPSKTIKQLESYMQTILSGVSEFKANFDALECWKQKPLERKAVEYSSTIDRITELDQKCEMIPAFIEEICKQVADCKGQKEDFYQAGIQMRQKNSELNEAIQMKSHSDRFVACQ